ncbi:MAG: hypothetical protein NTV46_12145 [Verrucomicrobia bacterium]|nr:hypothetical protein [Verrucomicrobiota bacterium]
MNSHADKHDYFTAFAAFNPAESEVPQFVDARAIKPARRVSSFWLCRNRKSLITAKGAANTPTKSVLA